MGRLPIGCSGASATAAFRSSKCSPPPVWAPSSGKPPSRKSLHKSLSVSSRRRPSDWRRPLRGLDLPPRHSRRLPSRASPRRSANTPPSRRRPRGWRAGRSSGVWLNSRSRKDEPSAGMNSQRPGARRSPQGRWNSSAISSVSISLLGRSAALRERAGAWLGRASSGPRGRPSKGGLSSPRHLSKKRGRGRIPSRSGPSARPSTPPD